MVQRRLTRWACQRRTVRGEMISRSSRSWPGGSSRASALAALPPRARASGQVAMRADAGYFAGALARAAHEAQISFAIGAKRIAPLWRLLAGIAGEDWLVLAVTLFAHDPATLGVDVLAGLCDDGVAGRPVGHARAESVRLGGCWLGLVR